MSLKRAAREHLYIKPMGYEKAKEVVEGLKIVNNGTKDARAKSIELVVAYGINPMLAQKMAGIKPQTALYPRIRELCEELLGLPSKFKPSSVLTEKQFEFYCDVIIGDGWHLSNELKSAAMVHLVYGEDDASAIESLFGIDEQKLSQVCNAIKRCKTIGL